MGKITAIQALIRQLPSAGKLIASKANALAVRLGIASSKISVDSLIKLARTNKISAAFIAYELYGVGSDIVEEMRRSDPQLSSIIETLAFSADAVDDTSSVTDISKFRDEFQLITDASDNIGGLDELLKIREAIALSDDTYKLYVQMRDMKSAL